ncbi:hypothetical protein C791_5595 [Amycolatopsis azurea DSM 43854]|uniref:Uncharacterized protein n=1 Tax=Amycolatopsis azurea DSM 43854 TaxID=1238180 RepID=M2PY24_9PSEU|nr:hypothetical protein C791_5595 [Amycolatopsis azurea DSM 43854]
MDTPGDQRRSERGRHRRHRAGDEDDQGQGGQRKAMMSSRTEETGHRSRDDDGDTTERETEALGIPHPPSQPRVTGRAVRVNGFPTPPPGVLTKS